MWIKAYHLQLLSQICFELLLPNQRPKGGDFSFLIFSIVSDCTQKDEQAFGLTSKAFDSKVSIQIEPSKALKSTSQRGMGRVVCSCLLEKRWTTNASNERMKGLF
jgi:hypothetical protein